MSLNTLTIESLKLQARRMRDHFAENDMDISYAAALETLAKQHGFKDWNILSATIKKQPKPDICPSLDQKISGTYLGHRFTGDILKMQPSNTQGARRYTIRFDHPIDVVESQHFSSYRQQINCFLDHSLNSVDHKGRPDNIVRLIPA